MKKEDIASLIVYVLMIVLAVVIGFTLVKDMFQYYNTAYGSRYLNPYVFSILTIVVSVLINAFGLELGHVLGGVMGGYSIASVNVFGLCLYKKENKFKFGFKDFDGLTGETVLAPKKEKSNPKLFVWMPLVLYIIELIACIVLYSLGNNKELANSSSPLIWVGTASIILVTISSMMAIYNFVPVKLDSMTDGYRLTLISKPVNVEAYNELMRIQECQRLGKDIGEVKVFDEITNFTASINLITVYEHLSRKEYNEALILIDKMLESDKISSSTSNRLIAQKLYIKIMTLSLDDARKYYDEEVDDNIRRFISNDLSMESIRAYVLIAGMLDESLGEVEFANSRKAKAMKRALKSRAKVEEELYSDALNIVHNAHPDWDMSSMIK